MRILKFYKQLKIKNKFFSVSLLLLFIFSFIGILTFNHFSNLYEKKIYEEAAKVLHITSTILDEELSKVERLSFQASTSDLIQKSLKEINRNKYSYEMYRTKVALIDHLELLINSEKYITSIQIKDINSITYTAGYKTSIYYNMIDEIKKIKELEGANAWIMLEDGNLLTASRLVKDTENLSLMNLGVFNISIDIEQVIDSTLNFSDNKNFIVKKNHKVIYSKDDKLTLDTNFRTRFKNGYKVKKINNEDYLVAYSRSRNSDLVYYNILPFENITKQTGIYKKMMIFVFLLMLLLTIILSYRAAKDISKPLEELTKKIKQAKNEGFAEKGNVISTQSNDEVDVLNRNFQLLLQKIDGLNKKNYRKEIIIKETEYKALQAQINPHFLYNTLDSINWIAQMNSQEKIATMIEALGNMMRNIISKRESLISIKEELEIVHSYITIQKYRYHNRLKFTINETVQYEKSSIPKLTIQPILENAIQHALEESIDPCHINVNFKTVKDCLEITIEDDGPGIDEKTIHSIYTNTVKNSGSGIGLFNITERIRLMFGPEYGLRFDSKVGIGTKVIIKLPITWG